MFGQCERKTALTQLTSLKRTLSREIFLQLTLLLVAQGFWACREDYGLYHCINIKLSCAAISHTLILRNLTHRLRTFE